MTFPLGDPVNRKPVTEGWVPVPGRPNWFKHRLTGVEKYVEPTKPPKIAPAPPFSADPAEGQWEFCPEPTPTPGPTGPVGPSAPTGDPDDTFYPYCGDEE